MQSLASGVLALSDAQASSPPLSLFTEIFSADGGMTGEGTSSLVFNVPRTFTKIRNTYDVFFDQIGQRSAAIGSVMLLDGVRYYDLSLFAHGVTTETATSVVVEVFEDGSLSDGGEAQVFHPVSSIPTHTWTRVILDVVYAPTPTFTLTFEMPPGTPASPAVENVPITPTIAGTTTSIYGGIEYVVFPETFGWRVYIDNVLIQAP